MKRITGMLAMGCMLCATVAPNKQDHGQDQSYGINAVERKGEHWTSFQAVRLQVQIMPSSLHRG
jgi:hypothetical protein